MIVELSVYKVTGAVSGLFTGIMSAVAVIDPSITNIVVVLIGAVVTITTGWMAYKTAALAKIVKEQEVKVAEVIKVTDGMKTELVAATARASNAEGQLKAKAGRPMKPNCKRSWWQRLGWATKKDVADSEQQIITAVGRVLLALENTDPAKLGEIYDRIKAQQSRVQGAIDANK